MKRFIKIMKLKFVLLAGIFSIPFISLAQNEVQLANIEVRYRMQPEEMPPVSVSDPAYKERMVEMDITFTIQDHTDLNTIEVKTGKQNGTSEYMNATLVHVKNGDKYFLSYNGKLFEIKDNKVVITEKVKEEASRKTVYVSIKASNHQQKTSNTIFKKIN